MKILNRWTGAVIKEVDGSLRGSDLSGSNLRDADLRDADLSGSDLSGSDLRDADLSGSDLSDADLRGSNLRDADLSGSNLRDADLSGSNLSDADLRGSNLRDADLRDADLSDAPIIPQIDAKILAAIEAGGTLKMSDWHSCETTHCRGGWAIHLAGAAGMELQRKVGIENAALLIYLASRPGESPPDFFCSDEKAMADIKACAARQLASK